MLPMAKPGLSTLAIYNGVTMWNEYIFAYTPDAECGQQDPSAGSMGFPGTVFHGHSFDHGCADIACLPMNLLFIFAQDKLIKGMTAGAVKGLKSMLYCQQNMQKQEKMYRA